MRLMPLFPYFLIGLLAVSIVVLWGAVTWQKTVFVQAFYVTTLLLTLSVFVSAAWASASYALKRFDGYWVSGYPILLVACVLGYGICKSAPQVSIVGILVGSLIVGWLVAEKLPGQLHRFIPLLTVVGFLVVGELPVWREGKALVLGVCAGLLMALIVGSRLRE